MLNTASSVIGSGKSHCHDYTDMNTALFEQIRFNFLGAWSPTSAAVSRIQRWMRTPTLCRGTSLVDWAAVKELIFNCLPENLLKVKGQASFNPTERPL